jgi:hypothetical protein
MTLKLENTGQETLELGFEIVQPGVSILQFEEGVQKRTNENSGKTTLQLPMVVDQVIEGPEDNEGRKLSHFVPIETDFGERQLAGILTLTGLVDKMAGKFGPEVEVTNESFINGLKLKMPGKFIKAYHELRKDMNGKDRTNITKFEKVGNKPHNPAQQKSKATAEDW